MGWEDRPYYRDRSSASANPILRMLGGSVPLFTAFGIRVRAHASLLILTGGTILLESHQGYPIEIRIVSMAILWVSVILHEFGHCLGARRTGGSANEVLLWPLGGLAYVDTPHRPLPTFLTALAGPLVTIALCAISAATVYFITPTAAMRLANPHATHLLVTLNPMRIFQQLYWNWHDPATYFWWFFAINYCMLLFNLLPIFPMDGGRMLQSALWPAAGHYRSTMIATTVGMGGSVVAGIVTLGMGYWFLALVFVWTFIHCYQSRMLLRETGPEDWQDSIDYSASIYGRDEERPKRRRRLSRRVIIKARRIAQREKAERDRIDTILAKVSANGMRSLTWIERRVLRKTTERHRRHELELSRFR